MASLKQFDVERARAGDLVVNSAGDTGKFVHESNKSLDPFKLLFVIDQGDYELSGWYDVNGLGSINNDFLRMASRKRTVWINSYKNPHGLLYPSEYFYSSEEMAKSVIDFNEHYLGTFPVEIEE